VTRSARSARRRDTAFAFCLALVLATGVLGVLLLNTSMQQQAQAMTRSHQRLSTLAEQVQRLQTAIDWASDPQRLAARARALRLRPVHRLEFVRAARPGDRVTRRVSERRPAAGRGRAG
jgi:hypothetical protein